MGVRVGRGGRRKKMDEEENLSTINPPDIGEPVIYQYFHSSPSIHPIRTVFTRLDLKTSHTHQAGARCSSTTPRRTARPRPRTGRGNVNQSEPIPE